MRSRPTIAIITATYGRPDVTELFVKGIHRLRNAISETFPVIVTGDNHPAFDDYDIEFYPQKNEPVSEKFNVSLRHAMKHNPRHIMIMGSDNLILNEQFTDLIKHKEGVDYLGYEYVFFYSLSGDTMGQIKEQRSSVGFNIVGAGRTMSYDLVERSMVRANKGLWYPPKNRSLDNLMFNNISSHIQKAYSLPGFVVDVKTEENINKFDLWKGLPNVTEGYVINQLSVNERRVIRKIKKKNGK
jgi:hypothetical protein